VQHTNLQQLVQNNITVTATITKKLCNTSQLQASGQNISLHSVQFHTEKIQNDRDINRGIRRPSIIAGFSAKKVKERGGNRPKKDREVIKL
jgi:hypothetical protein